MRVDFRDSCSDHVDDPNVPVCSPHVTFCGSSIMHPTEKLINIRIQTSGTSFRNECRYHRLSRKDPLRGVDMDDMDERDIRRRDHAGRGI